MTWKGLPEGPDSPDQCCLEIFVYATFAAPLGDFWPKPCAYQLQYSAQRIKDAPTVHYMKEIKDVYGCKSFIWQGNKLRLEPTFILLTSKWLIARWVLMRQWVFWLRFLTTFTVNLWFGMWTASRSSPLIIVGDHQPICWNNNIIVTRW